MQYRFINSLESDHINFLKLILMMILRPHGRPFEKIDFEIEAFALEIILDDQIFAKNISMNCYDFIKRGRDTLPRTFFL